MDFEQIGAEIFPLLLPLEEPQAAIVSNLQETWASAEALVSLDLHDRRQGLERLIESGAPRFSPLVAYILTTRLEEPDLPLRTLIIQTLASLFDPDIRGLPAAESVRAQLTASLAKIAPPEVLALLQAAEATPACTAQVARLLSRSAPAAEILVNILSDRQSSLNLRRQAIFFVGQVGYLDALPALERLQARLEARQSGQQAFLDLPGGVRDETSLLAELQVAFEYLRAR